MAEGKLTPWMKLPLFLFEEELSPWSMLVFAALLDEADRTKSDRAEIGMRRLERKLGTTRKTVMRATKELERRGFVRITAGTHSQRNAYEIPILAGRTGGGAPPVSKTPPVALRHRQPVALRPETGGVATPEPVAERHHGTDQTIRQDRLTAAAPRKPRVKPKARVRCEVWDTLCDLFENVVDPVADAKRIGLVAKNLRAKKATAAEMKIRAERYKRTWPDMEFTPEALNKHWKRFENESSGTGRPGRVEMMPAKGTGGSPFGEKR